MMSIAENTFGTDVSRRLAKLRQAMSRKATPNGPPQ